jgi:NTP pyrophosphatase (non-canonical NTP hydrolase)
VPIPARQAIRQTPQELWRGIHKLQEEMGELAQVLGKLAVAPDNRHWSGEDLIKPLYDELGDVCAAVDYFVEANRLDRNRILNRRTEKLMIFRGWILSGIKR